MHIQYDYDHRAFGKRLRMARRSARYSTQKKIAEEMGVSAKYISKLETGAVTPSLSFVMRFAEVTQADLNYLLLGSYPKNTAITPTVKDKPSPRDGLEVHIPRKDILDIEERIKTILDRLDTYMA